MNLNIAVDMTKEKFDAIIIGGSYSGLSAAMALGRALRKVLIIDSGKPANRFTPYSHNFITHDGRSPGEIASLAKVQLEGYTSVKQMDGSVVHVEKVNDEFIVSLASDAKYLSRKLIFATGIIDLMPNIPGFSECWGKSVLHCPYCHGYEVRKESTGIIGNGDYAFEFGSIISNWTNDLTIYTNGPSTLTNEQTSKLQSNDIGIVEDKIKAIEHERGYVRRIVFDIGYSRYLKAIYARPEFKQHSDIPKTLGCELTDDGYIKIDSSQKTTIPGIFACGDNVTRMRTVANAVSMGTTAGMMVNRELILEDF